MKEAYLYQKLKNKTIKCRLCQHGCLITLGQRGLCGVRENKSGVLYSLVYAQAISEAVDPIEKKPFFHFLPGSMALSVATLGCNLRCDNCQNWPISQGVKTAGKIVGQDLPPEKIIEDALKNKCASIAYTYTEPTIFFEYALDTMKLAKKKGLKNLFVSNGYMSDDCLKMADGYLDAINVDLKFFDDQAYVKNCGAHLPPILHNLTTLKKMGVWLEITTLVIPTLSDSTAMFEQMSEFIRHELGPEVPWHLSRFSGSISYKLGNIPDTPVDTLVRARKIGLKNGLRYVYIGNVVGEGENTQCPKCRALVIKRFGYDIERKDKQGRCPECGRKLEGKIIK
ncbi:MAG: AmmeMemoRadiSam system radical SAM enzyme [Patescibacteria group bacterium]